MLITVVYRVSRQLFGFLRVTFSFLLNFSLNHSTSERSANVCIQNQSKTREDSAVVKSNPLFVVERGRREAKENRSKFRLKMQIFQNMTIKNKNTLKKLKKHSESTVLFLRTLELCFRNSFFRFIRTFAHEFRFQLKIRCTVYRAKQEFTKCRLWLVWYGENPVRHIMHYKNHIDTRVVWVKVLRAYVDRYDVYGVFV